MMEDKTKEANTKDETGMFKNWLQQKEPLQ